MEKKVYFLGAWQDDKIDNQVIAQINAQIGRSKGTKVRLQLSRDGLRQIKSSLIQGKMLQDFIPISNIHFVTISQKMPDLLLVTSTSRETTHKFQIQVFRCANGLDSGMFLNAFRSLRKSVNAVSVKNKVNTDDINWTLRSKDHDNTKRELKQLVDLHGERAVVAKPEGQTVITTTTESRQIPNGHGHTEVYENGVRIPIYRKGRPVSVVRERVISDGDRSFDNSDNRSEVSESALRMELESLSHELRDIKIMLEKSTGITNVSEPNSPREFRQVNVQVTQPTGQPAVQPQTVVYTEVKKEDDIEAVVIDDDKEEKPRENGYRVQINGNVAPVRVSVPDYRGVPERTSTIQEPKPGDSGYVVTTITKPTKTSYESWKQNTMEKGSVYRYKKDIQQYNDVPERIQWRSRGSGARHVVAVRPRSVIPSFSSDAADGLVEVRHHPAGMGQQYQRVSFNPRVVERKSQSLKLKGYGSTTVAKPIDRVYVGRPDAKHHSLRQRPISLARPSVLVQEEAPTKVSHVISVEQNNNVVKLEDGDTKLLDVSEIDLYSDIPTHTADGVVIRT